MREFSSGATRDDTTGKPDYEGYLSPLALDRYGKYMLAHQVQADGKLRLSDNWMKGMGQDVYMKSAWRHFVTWWKLHRGYPCKDERDGHEITVDEAICGVLFNAFGYMHETLKQKETQ